MFNIRKLFDEVVDVFSPNTLKDQQKRIAQGKSRYYIKGEPAKLPPSGGKSTPASTRTPFIGPYSQEVYDQVITPAYQQQERERQNRISQLQQQASQQRGLVNSLRDVFDANTAKDRLSRVQAKAPETYEEQKGYAPGESRGVVGQLAYPAVGAATNLVASIGTGTQRLLGTGLQALDDKLLPGDVVGAAGRGINQWADIQDNARTQAIDQSRFSTRARQGEMSPLTGLSSAAGSVIPSIAGGWALRAPQAAATVGGGARGLLAGAKAVSPVAGGFGLSAGGQATREALEAGQSPTTSLVTGLGTGITEAGLEAVGFGKIGKPLINRALSESLQEMSQELGGNVWAKLGYDSEQDLLENVAQAGIYGGIIGGITSPAFDLATNKERQQVASELIKRTQSKLDPKQIQARILGKENAIEQTKQNLQAAQARGNQRAVNTLSQQLSDLEGSLRVDRAMLRASSMGLSTQEVNDPLDSLRQEATQPTKGATGSQPASSQSQQELSQTTTDRPNPTSNLDQQTDQRSASQNQVEQERNSLDSNIPQFTLKDARGGGQRVVVKRTPSGLKSELQQEEGQINPGAPTEDQIQFAQEQSKQNPEAKSLKEKADKQKFLELTDRYLGQEKAGQYNADTQARQFNDNFGSLTEDQKLEAILVRDGVKQGSKDPQVQAAVESLGGIFDNAYRYFTEQKGINMGYQHDYLPRIYKLENGETVNAQEYKVAQQGSGRQKGRTFQDINPDALISKDPADLIQRYYASLERAAAGKQYVKDLEQEGLLVRSTEPVRGLRPVIAEGLQPDDGSVYYARKDVASRLNNLFGDKEAVQIHEKIMDKAAHISGAIQTIVLSGGLPGTPINNFAIMQGVKEAMGGHPINATKAFLRAFSTKLTNKAFDRKQATIKEMAELGVDPRASLAVDRGALAGVRSAENKRGEVAALFHAAVDDPTFKRMLPLLTIHHYETAKSTFKKRGATDKEAAQMAAENTRNWFGVTRPAKAETRAQVASDAATTFLLAPKFRESMVNFWVNNAKVLNPKNTLKPEYRDNAKFIVIAGIVYAAMSALNEALNGAPMHDNPDDKEDKLLIPADVMKSFGIDTGGKDVAIPFLSSIATLPRNAAKGVGGALSGDLEQVGKSIGSLASIPLSNVFDVLTNEDYFGAPIYDRDAGAGEKLGSSLSYLVQNTNHPWVREALNAAGTKLPEGAKDFIGVRDQSGFETASRALEFPLRFYNPDYYAYDGNRLDKDQREQLRDMPSNQRQQFIDEAIGRKRELRDIKESGAALPLNAGEGSLSDRTSKLRDDAKDAGKSLEDLRNENNLPESVDSYERLAAHISNNYEDFVEAYNLDTSDQKRGTGQYADLIEKNTASEKITKARNLYKGDGTMADVPDWVKQRYYKEAGVTEPELELDIAAGFKVADKAEYIAQQIGQLQPNERINKLAEWMKPTVSGKYFASYGVIDELEDKGLLSDDQAKALKRLKWDEESNKFVDKYSSSGSSGSGGSGMKYDYKLYGGKFGIAPSSFSKALRSILEEATL